jgi:hypothetical protein
MDDDRIRLAQGTANPSGSTELRGALQELPLRRDELPSALPGGLVLLFVLVIAAVVGWRLHLQRRTVRRLAPDAEDGRNEPGQPAGWLARALGAGDPLSPRIVNTVRLGPRAHLHVIRWHGRELLVGAGQGGAPSLIAERIDLGDAS